MAVLTLSLCTSSARTHVLVARGLDVLGQASCDPPVRAGDALFSLLDRALAEASVERRDLEAIVCDVGPGSFTGVRVGVATARALGFALAIPTYAVCSLRALAAWVPSPTLAVPSPTFAVLDAGRGELHSAAFDGDQELVAPAHLALDATRARRPPGARVVGTGLAGAAYAVPDARLILLGAQARLAAGAPAEELEPLYLRPPDVTLPAGTREGPPPDAAV